MARQWSGNESTSDESTVSKISQWMAISVDKRLSGLWPWLWGPQILVIDPAEVDGYHRETLGLLHFKLSSSMSFSMSASEQVLSKLLSKNFLVLTPQY